MTTTKKPSRVKALAFDPWTASWEEAQAAHEDTAGPEGAIFQWIAAQGLKNPEQNSEGDGFSVLAAVASCAMHGLVMPDWLARAFLRRYRAVQQLRVDSWDAPEAFGRPYPKGAQITAMRRRRLNRLKVALAVRQFVEMHPDAPLDPEWSRIGSLVAKSDKEAQKLFSEALKMGLAIEPSEIRSRQGYPRVPSKSRKVSGRQRKTY